VEKVRYMISDAASKAGVETHVLRYWEEELDLTIPRNEMGHRYYTRENIKEFQKIKELKEKLSRQNAEPVPAAADIPLSLSQLLSLSSRNTLSEPAKNELLKTMSEKTDE